MANGPDKLIEEQSLTQLCFMLWHRLDPRRRRQFISLLLLMLIASFSEVVSLGLLLPFLGLLAEPGRVFAHPLALPVIEFFNIQSAKELLLPVVVAFCIATIVSGGIRLLLMYANIRFSQALGADFSLEVYRRTLYQPYEVHVSRNSSEVITGITGKVGMLINGVIVPILTLLSSFVLFISIFLAIIAIDPMVAIVSSLVFGLTYGVILKISRRQLYLNSKSVARESTAVLKSIQEGLGGIRDVLIDGTQEVYCRLYQRSDRALRHALGQTTFISTSPRYLIETLGMIMIATLAYSMAQREGGMTSTIPILGAIALGAQRLLPVLQQSYAAIAIIRGAEASLRDVMELLEQPVPSSLILQPTKPVKFQNDITLDSISFRYISDGPPILKEINLSIKKGQSVGFIGETGSGKSTLLDIVMGLLHPNDGKIRIDGMVLSEDNQRAWQQHIAHVPQHIFLSDSTIKENIAFGTPYEQIDQDRVEKAATQAQLKDVVANLPEKYDTKVGEQGVRLSGGQRQRIGIARALYRNADVIIFDEATSALDSGTERIVTEAINALGDDLTLLIIAHREQTLENCDIIFELKNGEINRQISYEELTLNR